MEELYILLLVSVILCLITFFIGWYFSSRSNKAKVDSAESIAKKILSDAENKSQFVIKDAEKRAAGFQQDAEKAAQNLKKEKLLEVKDEFYRRKQKFDEDVKIREKDVVEFERKLKNEKKV